MDETLLLAAIDQETAGSNVAIFRFNRSRTVSNLVLYAGLTVGLVVVGLRLRGHLNLAAGGVAYGVVGVWALIIGLSFWRSLNKGLDLMHAETNVLVVAPFGVVQRLRGRVKSWSFAEFVEATVVKSKGNVESIYLNRRGATFDELLVDDGTFGSMEEIAQALRQYQSGERGFDKTPEQVSRMRRASGVGRDPR